MPVGINGNNEKFDLDEIEILEIRNLLVIEGRRSEVINDIIELLEKHEAVFDSPSVEVVK